MALECVLVAGGVAAFIVNTLASFTQLVMLFFYRSETTTATLSNQWSYAMRVFAGLNILFALIIVFMQVYFPIPARQINRE